MGIKKKSGVLRMTPLNKAKIPFKPAMVMVKDYIKSKLSEQVKAVAFIIFYLVAFKKFNTILARR